MQEDNKDGLKKDEIDLGPVLNAIRDFFRAVGEALVLAGKAIKFYLIRLVFVVIIALLIGYGIYKIQNPVYYSSMVVTSQYLSPEYYHHIISEMDLLIKDRNFEVLADKLNIPDTTAEEFQSIYYLPLVVEGDTIKEHNPFRVVVASHDGRIFNELTDPLAHFLENNEFVRHRKQIRIQQLESAIATLDGEIEQLDSLKKVMEKSLLNPNISSAGITLSESPDPVSVYEQKMEMFNSKQYNVSQLAQKENIQVVHPFTIRTKADKPDLLLTLFTSFWMGLIVGIIYVSIRFKRKMA